MGRYDAKRPVYVVPYTGAVIKYGFLTNVKDTTSTALGHVAIGNPYPEGLVFGANAPKPGKASKASTTGIESSFYSTEKVAALRTDKWRLSLPTIRRGGAKQKSKTVYVTVGTVKYAWVMPLETHTKLADNLEALGIKEGLTTDKDLVFGASYPKPPKASKQTADAIFTTFIDPSKTLPEGWQSSGKERVS